MPRNILIVVTRAHRRGWLTATRDRSGACQGLRGPFLLPETEDDRLEQSHDPSR